MSNNVGTPPARAEEQVVNRFGYKQELRRKLQFFSMFAVAFSIISITTGIFLNYGFGLTYLGPAMIWIWPIVVVGQMLVALVVAELGTRIPLAGYAYQWTARLVNPTYGWFVGYFAILYNFFGLSGITLLATAPLLCSEFTSSASPHLVLAVAIVLLVIAIVINVISVQLTARVNNVAVFTEICGSVLFAIVLIVLWGLRAPSTNHSGASILSSTVHLVHNPLWYEIVLASLVGIYTLVGFEVCADLSEESINAGLTVPRAVLWAVGMSGILGMVVLIGFTLAIPNLKEVEASGTPLVVIAQFWLGTPLRKVLIALVVFSMFAIAVVGTAGAGRTWFSLARDNMLPWSKELRRVYPGTQTPIIALVVSGALCIAVMIYGYSQPNTFGTLVAATAIIPYVIYFMITLAYMLKRETLEHVPGEFSLGRWGIPVMIAVLVWSLIAMGCLSLPAIFHGADRAIGYCLVVAVIWYFAALRGRLKRGTAGPTSIEQVMAKPDSGTDGGTASVK